MDKLKSLKILYVEDDELIRENTAEILERKCNSVITAVDGTEGYEKYLEFEPDIIITDIQMPRMNGLDMIKKIRLEDLDVNIIITTAYSDNKYLLEAVDMQLIKYVTKPLTWEKISDSLKECLRHIGDNITTLKKLADGYTYDTFTKALSSENGDDVSLSKHERQLLELLVKNMNNVVQYEPIENFVWPDIGMSTDAIKSLTKGLRKKLPKGSLENIYATGYKLIIIE